MATTKNTMVRYVQGLSYLRKKKKEKKSKKKFKTETSGDETGIFRKKKVNTIVDLIYRYYPMKVLTITTSGPFY